MGRHRANEESYTQELSIVPEHAPARETPHVVRSHRRPRNKIVTGAARGFFIGALLLFVMSITQLVGSQGLKIAGAGTAYVPVVATVKAAKPVPSVEPTPVIPPPVKPPAKPVVPQAPVTNKVEKVISYAMAQLGKRYVWAAAGPNAFDCSGLVLMAFKQVGIALPHYTGTMINKGKAVSRSNMVRGDIIFPERGHVGIYLGNGKYIAAESNGVVTAKVTVFYAARRLL